MSDNLTQYRGYARILLAGIRLFNGGVALFAPTLLAHRLGAEPNTNRTDIYALRLFGVRTIVIGLELLLPDEASQARSLRYAVPIHASDTISAVLAGVQKQLPPRTSIMLTVISAVNTALAIFAQPR